MEEQQQKQQLEATQQSIEEIISSSVCRINTETVFNFEKVGKRQISDKKFGIVINFSEDGAQSYKVTKKDFLDYLDDWEKVREELSFEGGNFERNTKRSEQRRKKFYKLGGVSI